MIICMMWWFAGLVWESARFDCARLHDGMLLLDLEIVFLYSVCSLLGLFVDAALYLLLSRKWCPPWEDGADADPMLVAMTEKFAGELIGCFQFDDVCFFVADVLMRRELLCCRLVLCRMV